MVDHTAVRCPAVAHDDALEFARWVPVPPPDAVGADGKPAYSAAALMDWNDAYERAEYRKNRAGQRLIREAAACRGEPRPEPKSS